MKRYLLLLSICLGSQLYGTETTGSNELAGLAERLTKNHSEYQADQIIFTRVWKYIHPDYRQARMGTRA